MNQFDWIFYTNYYNDIKAAGINTKEKAIEHYTTHGSLENRKNHMDIEKYLKFDDPYGTSLLGIINNDSFFGVSVGFLIYLIKECKIPINSKILEIGCGIACLSLPIIKHVKLGQYCGIDIDKKCVEWCQQKITPLCGAVFKHGSEDNHNPIPFNNMEFDLVYSVNTFIILPSEHVNRYLDEINRVLKKGGQLIITLFMWNHTVKTRHKNKHTKIRLFKINNNTYLTNNYNERAIVHQDTHIYTCLENANFEIKETIFGYWSGMSSAEIYMDLIHAVKIK